MEYKKCPDCGCETLEVRKTGVFSKEYVNGKPINKKQGHYRLAQTSYFCTECNWADETY